MIIGEAPGRREIETGTPFIGASGLLLGKALQQAGSDPGSFYITNVFKGDVGEGNRNPSAAEIADHRDILEDEIKAVSPAAILLLGSVATRQFVGGRYRMREVVGREYYRGGPSFVPCYHPAATMYNHELLDTFYKTVEMFVDITKEHANGNKDRYPDRYRGV